MTETRGDARKTMGKIWPGARTEQAATVGLPTRAGVSIAVRPGHEARLIGWWTLTKDGWKGFAQVEKCELGQTLNIMGVYISPQSRKEQTEALLRK